MRFVGLTSLLLTVALILWLFSNSPVVERSSTGSEDGRDYKNTLESAEDAANMLSR